MARCKPDAHSTRRVRGCQTCRRRPNPGSLGRWSTSRFRPMLVLGIETSCDETGVALYDTAAGLLAQSIYSQVELHARYGGVVPELASRDHIRKIVPLTSQLLDRAGRSTADLDGVAYTAGPGPDRCPHGGCDLRTRACLRAQHTRHRRPSPGGASARAAYRGRGRPATGVAVRRAAGVRRAYADIPGPRHRFLRTARRKPGRRRRGSVRQGGQDAWPRLPGRAGGRGGGRARRPGTGSAFRDR